MYGTGYKYLLVSFLLLLGLASSALAGKEGDVISAFYNPPLHEVTAPPPNYNLIDSSIFAGVPPFAEMSEFELGGYYLYFDESLGRWTLCSVVVPGGQVFEQLHGSILVQMDREPETGVNVWPLGFVVSEDLKKNDRWGWVKWPESIAPDLYEIWWDYTVDYTRLEKTTDYQDTIGISFSGCAFDFNIWASGHFQAFELNQLKLGGKAIPISEISGFADTYEGLEDQYQADISVQVSNTTLFTEKDLPGRAYNVNGQILPGTTYGDKYGRSIAYEGNGIQFSVATCPPENPPTFDPPLGYTTPLTICLGEMIIDTIIAVDPDEFDTVTVSIISGPGTLTTEPGNPAIAIYQFTPDTAGDYTVVYQAVDLAGLSYVDSVTYQVLFNQPPSASASDSLAFFCWDLSEICYTVSASDNEGDALLFTLLDGPGSINPETGELCFTPTLPGVYGFSVEVSDGCGSDTISFSIIAKQNRDPQIDRFDSLIQICGVPDSVCFDITAFDPDLNDSLAISIISGPGQFEPTGNGSGRQCFLPDNVDSARYVFYYSVTDECWRELWGEKLATPPPQDSIVIVVITGTPPEIVCPEPVDINLCAPDSVWYDIGVIPSDANVVVTGDAIYSNGQLCFYAGQTGQYQFTLTVTNECGEVICSPVFNVTVGTPPEIVCPDPVDINLCAPDSVCIDIGIIPSDANVIVTGDAVYANGQLCFYAGQTGQYQFTLTVTNECGEVICSPVFNVTVGTPPEIVCPDPVDINLCAPDSVFYDIGIIPVDANVVVTGDAVYANGQLSFYAGQTGQYQFTLTVTNECGEVICSPVFNVTVGIPPEIVCPEPVDINLCAPDSVCYDIGVIPSDANVVVTGDAVYANGQLCFFAGQTGQYQFTLTVTNGCGEVICSPVFNVTINEPPVVSIPDSSIYLCQDEVICLPITATDPDGDSIIFLSPPPGYSIQDGAICFGTDGSGRYEFVVEVEDSCGHSASATAYVDVIVNDLPIVSVGDSSLFLCEATEVCLPVTFSDDGTIDSIVATPPAYYNANDQTVCLDISGAGEYTATVTVYDNCEVAVSATGNINVSMNNRPQISLGQFDNPIYMCVLEEICIPVDAFDPDGNLISIVGSGDCGEIIFNEIDSVVCWMPSQFGVCSLYVVATDICDAADTAIMEINLVESPDTNPLCLPDTTVYLCEPGEVCLNIGLASPSSNIIVRPPSVAYNPDTGDLCFTVEGDSSLSITVVDSTECGIDSCMFTVTANVNLAPRIAEIGDIDFVYCDMTELCLDLNINDPDSNIYLVQLFGDCSGVTYDEASEQVCVELDGEINCQLNVMVTDSCGLADTMSVNIHATPNQAPGMSLPNIEAVVRCVSDSTPIVIDGFCASDPEYGDLSVTLDSGSGEFSFNELNNCGSLSFMPTDNDSALYCFRFMVADVCDTIYTDYCVEIIPASVCSSCVSIAIVAPPCTNTGGLATVNIVAEAVNEMAGYDLLIAYDGTALNFTRAILGEAMPHWEFFTYRFGQDGNCSGDCPSGMLRLVAIADVNDGAHHPPPEEYLPSGTIASITFRISSDLNLGGHYIPIEFFWFDCGDNTASDPSGQFLYMDQIILGPEGNILWDEANDDAYPESDRYEFYGAPDECLSGEKELPVRCIDFQNGSLCITHPDSVDARGDMNLNGVAYEIADAVVYTNFFISGISAFGISVPGQIAASDINADGKTLSIADLVYLVRIITGDAPPFPKLTTSYDEVILSSDTEQLVTTIAIDSPHDIGAALLVFNGIGSAGGEPRLVGDAARSMDMMYAWVDGTLRVLIYTFDASARISSGQSTLLEVVSSEGGRVELISAEMADYYANEIAVKINQTSLPNLLELTQNHPNPFNPTTTFTMSLPFASDYTVTIFNVTGQKIKEWYGYGQAGLIEFTWDGTDENGQQSASGIYLYRAQAAGSEAIRKMILLK